MIGEEDVSTRQLSARIVGSDPAALTRLLESLPDFLGEARVDKPATFDIRLGKALEAGTSRSALGRRICGWNAGRTTILANPFGEWCALASLLRQTPCKGSSTISSQGRRMLQGMQGMQGIR